MRIIVGGSRSAEHDSVVWTTLAKMHHTRPITEILTGGATGVDSAAAMFGIKMQIPTHTDPVTKSQWDRYGRAAGPIRNQRMLDQFHPDLVVAFLGGKGTENLKILTRAAGVILVEVVGVPAPESLAELRDLTLPSDLDEGSKG